MKKNFNFNIFSHIFFIFIYIIIFIFILFSIFTINSYCDENYDFDKLLENKNDLLNLNIKFTTLFKFDLFSLNLRYFIINSFEYKSNLFNFLIEFYFNTNLFSYIFLEKDNISEFYLNLNLMTFYYNIKIFEIENFLFINNLSLELENGLRNTNFSILKNNFEFIKFYEGNLPLEVNRNYFSLNFNTNSLTNKFYYFYDNYFLENLIFNIAIINNSFLFLFDKTSNKFYIPELISFETYINLTFFTLYFYFITGKTREEIIISNNNNNNNSNCIGINLIFLLEEIVKIFKSYYSIKINIYYSQNSFGFYKSNILSFFNPINQSYFDYGGLSILFFSKNIFLYQSFIILKKLTQSPIFSFNSGICLKFNNFYITLKHITYDKDIYYSGIYLEFSFNF